MLRYLLVLVCPLIFCSRTNAQSEVPQFGEWHSDSPDGKRLAAVREEPSENMIWRMDLDLGALEIVDVNGNTLGKYERFNFNRLPVRIEWSPDSQYLVMTTTSPGGHSPWNYRSFVYSTQDRTLREMDGPGPVVSPLFKFTGPHNVQIVTTLDGDYEHPKSVIIDLDQKFSTMSKKDGQIEGDLRKN
jgi:dipeptidyl aminopeptidase/acylaminoacyl peptidase